MRDKRLKVILTCLIVLFSVVLAACDQAKDPILKAETVKRESIPFRITWTDYSGRGVAIRKIVDLYNQDLTNTYEIVMQSGDENLETIEGLLAEKGNEPILVLPYRFVKYFGDKEALLDLTGAFQNEKDLFYPELWKLGTVKGKAYGIPWLGHSICLIYNKTLLEKAEVDPATITSLDTLVKALEKVEAKTEAKGIGLVGANHKDLSWMVNQFIYGFGSALVDETGQKVVINNEKSKAAIEFYKNVLGAHAQYSWLTDTGVEVMDYFRNQEIAFEFQGVWGVEDIDKNGKPFEIGIINLETIGLYAEVGPLMLSLPQSMTGDKQTEALRFIAFMISKTAQEKIMDGEYSPEHDTFYPFRVPTRMDLTDSLVFKKYPQYLPFVEGFKRPSIDVPVAGWQTIKDLYYTPGLNQVMKSEITIDAFLKLIETRGNEILNEK